jgi:hypothetical protein
MTKPYIKYKSGYKYQLVEEYQVKVSVIPIDNIKTDYIELDTEGMLIIKKGYAWDGPSGPTWDTPNFMRGSLVHDALYQLLRSKLLEQKWEKWRKEARKEADKELRRICREDGMSRIRAWYVYQAVSRWGGRAADPESRKKIHVAPEGWPG